MTAEKRTTRTAPARDERMTRDQETWDADAVHQDFGEISEQMGSLPYIEPREGFEQRWIRTKIGGEDDPKNLSAAYNRGWRRRDKSTLPSHYSAPLIHVDNIGECVGLSGMVLMERPIRLGDQYRKKVSDQTKAQMMSVDQQLMQTHSVNSGFGAPGRVEDRSAVEVGAGMPVDDD